MLIYNMGGGTFVHLREGERGREGERERGRGGETYRVLIIMFAPSASYLNASGWTVDSCMQRIGEPRMLSGLL